MTQQEAEDRARPISAQYCREIAFELMAVERETEERVLHPSNDSASTISAPNQSRCHEDYQTGADIESELLVMTQEQRDAQFYSREYCKHCGHHQTTHRDGECLTDYCDCKAFANKGKDWPVSQKPTSSVSY